MYYTIIIIKIYQTNYFGEKFARELCVMRAHTHISSSPIEYVVDVRTISALNKRPDNRDDCYLARGKSLSEILNFRVQIRSGVVRKKKPQPSRNVTIVGSNVTDHYGYVIPKDVCMNLPNFSLYAKRVECVFTQIDFYSLFENS